MHKNMARRIIGSYFIILVAMFLTMMRLVNVAFDPKLQNAVSKNSFRSITVGLQRGTIYDCNMKPLTNNVKKYISVITDEKVAFVTLSRHIGEVEATRKLKDAGESGNPVIYTDCEIKGAGLECFMYYDNDISVAKHLLGYTDDGGHGISGLHRSLDSLLFTGSKFEIAFKTDGIGRIVQGEDIVLSKLNGVEQSGVMLTIDREIQKIAEDAAVAIETGAVVITEVATGEIKAMVSRPDFDINNIAAALNNENSPLLNRALMTYNVGSGFKPCVAAAAIESGYSDYLWYCEGACDIDGQRFVCHKSSGHKWLDMAGALKKSCNTFFYNIAVKVGAERVYRMAENAGFDNSVSFGYGFETGRSDIGNKKWLMTSDRALANLSIGQGELMVSPVAILNLYCAIAGDGSYYPPCLIKGHVKRGELADLTEQNAKVRLMSESTAKELRKQLLGVLSEGGTGTVAKPKLVTAAGKTSTAQTGIIKNGERVVNTWFCGFFPYDNPKYAVAVLSENSNEGCGGVFAEIADEITEKESAIDNYRASLIVRNKMSA